MKQVPGNTVKNKIAKAKTQASINESKCKKVKTHMKTSFRKKNLEKKTLVKKNYGKKVPIF